MPRYKVIIHGEGIEMHTMPGDARQGAEKPIVGFYTTRFVEADSLNEVDDAVERLIHDEWSRGEYAANNKGDLPRVTVDRVYKPTLWERLFKRYQLCGSTFYSDD